jgi:hypothetical protein
LPLESKAFTASGKCLIPALGCTVRLDFLGESRRAPVAVGPATNRIVVAQRLDAYRDALSDADRDERCRPVLGQLRPVGAQRLARRFGRTNSSAVIQLIAED